MSSRSGDAAKGKIKNAKGRATWRRATRYLGKGAKKAEREKENQQVMSKSYGEAMEDRRKSEEKEGNATRN